MKIAFAIQTAVGAASLAIQGFMATMVATAGTTNILVVGITAIKTALLAITGPIGLGVAAIGLLVGGLSFLWGELNKIPPEVEQMSSSMEEAAEASKSLKEGVESSAKAHESAVKGINQQSESLQKLADDVVALSEKEHKSAADKKDLENSIESLNQAVEGLGLAYNEETGHINMSTEALKAKIEMMKAEEQQAESNKRLAEIDKERTAITDQLTKNTEQLNAAEQKLNETGFWSFGVKNELKTKTEELKGANEELTASLTTLDEEYSKVQAEQQAAADAYNQAAATYESANQRIITSIEDLEGAQRSAAEGLKEAYGEIADSATDMFDRIEGKSKLSAQEMLDNLLHNQQMVADWANNIAQLAEKGLGQGLLDKLRQLGPQGAAAVAELNKMTSAELQAFNAAFEKAGITSVDALLKAFGGSKDRIPPEILSLVTAAEQSLSQQVQAANWSASGQQVTDQFVQGMQGLPGGVQGPVNEMTGEALAAMSQFGADAGAMAGQATENVRANMAPVGTFADFYAQLPPQVQAYLGEYNAVVSMLTAETANTAYSNTSTVLSMADWYAQLPSWVQASLSEYGITVDTLTAQAATTAVNNTSTVANAGAYWRDLQYGATTETQTMSNNVASATSNVASTVESNSQQVAAAKAHYETLRDVSINALQTMGGQIAFIFLKIHNDAVHETRSMESDVSSNFQTMQSNVQSQLQTMESNMTTSMANMESSAQTGGQGIVSAVQSAMDSVVSAVNSGMNNAIAAMNSAQSGAYNAGYNMGIGFYNGLASMAGSIYALAGSIAANAAATIRAALDIHSPSRVTTKLGEFTGEGFEIGLESKVADVESVANKLAESAVPKVDLGASLSGVPGAYAMQQSATYNNQSYTFNAGNGDGSRNLTREDMQRLFKEFMWYTKVEEARM